MPVEIDGVKYSRTQPVCDDCWWKWRDREPVRMKNADEEKCCLCGDTTHSGIYIRVNPARVAHPTPEVD